MADYIKTNILFESYVHIDAEFDDATDANEHIRREITDYMARRSQHFLYDDVDTEVNFKEGSIKIYATVRGSLKKSLGIYEDFTKGITRLFWFSKRLSDASVVEIAFITGSFLGAIERTEARPGIVGQTKRIVDSISTFNSVEVNREAKALTKNLRVTRLDIENLFRAIDDAEDLQLLKTEFTKLFRRAPRRLANDNISDENKELYTEQHSLFASAIRV